MPPYVLLSDNNETGFIRLGRLLEDYRLDPQIAQMKSGPDKMRALRKIYREGFGERYRLLMDGIESEIPQWKDRIFLMGYGSFGQKFGVANLPREPDRHIVPWVWVMPRPAPNRCDIAGIPAPGKIPNIVSFLFTRDLSEVRTEAMVSGCTGDHAFMPNSCIGQCSYRLRPATAFSYPTATLAKLVRPQ